MLIQMGVYAACVYACAHIEPVAVGVAACMCIFECVCVSLNVPLAACMCIFECTFVAVAVCMCTFERDAQDDGQDIRAANSRL